MLAKLMEASTSLLTIYIVLVSVLWAYMQYSKDGASRGAFFVSFIYHFLMVLGFVILWKI